jgi:hypothetical protein
VFLKKVFKLVNLEILGVLVVEGILNKVAPLDLYIFEIVLL